MVIVNVHFRTYTLCRLVIYFVCMKLVLQVNRILRRRIRYGVFLFRAHRIHNFIYFALIGFKISFISCFGWELTNCESAAERIPFSRITRLRASCVR